MELKNFFAQTLSGDVIAAPTVHVYKAGTNQHAVGLQDRAGAALANPFVGTDNGQITLAAPDGDYDLRVIGSGRDFSMRVRFIDPATTAQTVLDMLSSTDDSKGAHLIAVMQDGPAATKRTLQDVARDIKSPLSYGALGDGASHPASTRFATLADLQAKYPFASSLTQELDWLGWQSCLNAGGEVNGGSRTYKMCNADPASQQLLVFVAGRSWVRGSGFKFDWSQMTAKSDNTHLAANWDFTTSASWTNSPLWTAAQMTPAVFGSGVALYTDPAAYPGAQGHFTQFGQQMTLQPGKYHVECTFTTTRGASYANGNPNPPWCTIQYFANGIGDGGNPFGKSAKGSSFGAVLAGGSVTQTIGFDITVQVQTTGFLTFSGGGYANFSVDSFDVRPWVPNAAVLMTRDGATEHYPIFQPLQGAKLVGPGNSSGCDAVLFKSFDNLDGNASKIKEAIITGWNRAITPSDGAYLLVFESCEIYGNAKALGYERAAYNAGENIRFISGGIYNNGIGIDNAGGAEITLHGTALDYNNGGSIVNNAGRVELYGVHAEMQQPSTPGKPTYHCLDNGRIIFVGGMHLAAGTPKTAAEPPVKLDTVNASMEFVATAVYNLSSASGVACSGPGSLKFTSWQNNGNPNISLLSRAAAMDCLGGAGGFEAPAGAPYLGVDTGGIYVAGGLWPDAGAVITSRWVSNHLTAAPSATYARSGARSLKVSKIGVGVGTAGQLALLIPCRQGHDLLGEMYFMFPEAVGAGTATLYFRLNWCRVIGEDAYGRPRFGPEFVFKGETDLVIPLDGSGAGTWIRRGIGTTYHNASNDQSIGAPAWATHLAVLIDHTSIPAMSYYIDDLVANIL